MAKTPVSVAHSAFLCHQRMLKPNLLSLGTDASGNKLWLDIHDPIKPSPSSSAFLCSACSLLLQKHFGILNPELFCKQCQLMLDEAHALIQTK